MEEQFDCEVCFQDRWRTARIHKRTEAFDDFEISYGLVQLKKNDSDVDFELQELLDRSRDCKIRLNGEESDCHCVDFTFNQDGGASLLLVLNKTSRIS